MPPRKKGSRFLKELPAVYVQIHVNITKPSLNNPDWPLTSALPVWAPPAALGQNRYIRPP